MLLFVALSVSHFLCLWLPATRAVAVDAVNFAIVSHQGVIAAWSVTRASSGRHMSQFQPDLRSIVTVVAGCVFVGGAIGHRAG